MRSRAYPPFDRLTPTQITVGQLVLGALAAILGAVGLAGFAGLGDCFGKEPLFSDVLSIVLWSVVGAFCGGLGSAIFASIAFDIKDPLARPAFKTRRWQRIAGGANCIFLALFCFGVISSAFELAWIAATEKDKVIAASIAVAPKERLSERILRGLPTEAGR